MSFGSNLATLRTNVKLSQEDLANELDVTRQAVSKWELDQSKPDWDNLIKISKFFSVTVDDLLGNKEISKSAFSINPLKVEPKKVEKFKIARLVIAALFIVFLIIVIYKFTMLFIITSKVEQYKELNNYHYVVSTIVGRDIIEKEECWFKDGVSKTVKNDYSYKSTSIIYINYNKKEGYMYENLTGDKTEINVNEYILYNPGFENGGQLYAILPIQIRYNSVMKILKSSINNTKMNIQQVNNDIFINTNNSYINLEKDTFLPLTEYKMEKSDDQFMVKRYEIDLNFVEDIKI